jgi:uncharacterized protein (TIGR03118 family)
MRRSAVATALVAVLVVSYLGTAAAVKTGGYVEKDLVANVKPLTDKNGIVHNDKDTILDPHLVNPWGVTERFPSLTQPGSPFWVSDNGAGVSTLYNIPGNAPNSVTINPLVVSIPTCADPLGNSGTPTGAVFNTDGGATGGFKISGFDKAGKATTASAVFLFVTEDGTIVGWNPGVNPKDFDPAKAGTYGIIAFPDCPLVANAAVYKGLAIATNGTDTFLYVTNFRSGMVEVYNDTFHAVTFDPPAFVDPNLPKSYAPFNIALIGGRLVVTYAVQDAAKHDDVAGQGHGIVNVFDLNGHSLQRFAQHGQLDSPWGVALAPTGFGELGGALWIGNFGNGQINAFDPESGKFLSKVRDPKGQAILIDGLWTITFGNGSNGGATNTLYFTAGPNDEKDGLFGSLSPSPN